MGTMIKTKDLTKKYGSNVVVDNNIIKPAVSKVERTVEKKEIKTGKIGIDPEKLKDVTYKAVPLYTHARTVKEMITIAKRDG